jgi:hypothetical protein
MHVGNGIILGGSLVMANVAARLGCGCFLLDDFICRLEFFWGDVGLGIDKWDKRSLVSFKSG